ncbi:hypothetical protein V5279_23840 [Bradyrhizobium sp. 26S5]|uniref:hypothetical protein n=1 Tax=Bradyrhizobium sp. 26S5 TaxID=3139729 RepID=UPI0030D28D08
MTQADRVHSTPPLNTSAIDREPPTDTTRRHFLTRAAGVAAGGSVLALAAIPPVTAAAAPAASLAGVADPIFALIEDHRRLQTLRCDLSDELDGAEYEAAKEHGWRPVPLTHWRNYHIGGSEIDDRREQLLREAEIDPAIIEREYLDAKARVRANWAAGEAWDERAGLVVKRENLDRVTDAEDECAGRLSRMKPTTPAGAAALIQYVIDDEICPEVEWHMTALRSVVAALNSMGAAVQS